MARALDIDCIVLNLAILEPPDLVGIPQVGPDGRTHYAPPAVLPKEGRGLLILEEPNRAPRYMLAPCLQLLTARTLHEYALPPGWLPCAIVNPGQSDDDAESDPEHAYHVDSMDPAMWSRFVQFRVVADVEAWLMWAGQNNIHPKIIEFVRHSPGVFGRQGTNPRACAFASRIVRAWEKEPDSELTLALNLCGVLGEHWGTALLHTILDDDRPLTPHEIVEEYDRNRGVVKTWLGDQRLDLVAASLEALKRFLRPNRNYERVVHDEGARANVVRFLLDLPANLKSAMQEWLTERGFEAL